MHGVIEVNEPFKSISAVRPKRPNGHQQRKKARRGGHSIMWKRITANFDEAVKQFGANPAIAAPLTRLVFFEHLTKTQGMAGRRYADVVRKYERFHMAAGSRSAKSCNLEPARNTEDQELERIANRGKMREYEAAAKVAKREYKRAMRVLEQFADPITGRNFAKDALDNLCLADVEPPANYRASIAAVLTMMAQEFAVKEKR